MKATQKVKTLNRDELAGRHGEGSSTTLGDGYTDSVNDFITKNHQRLTRWCHRRYNGNGNDVMHTAIETALERRYEYMTFRLFRDLCREAARNLGIHRWVQDDQGTIILPPTQLAAERLDAHLAVAPGDDKPEFPADCIRAARKLMWLERKGQPCLWSGGVR